ncbi:DUF2867 domain-containing protein [Vibrio sp. Of7-15]|uniref:DUF2867 domain-containing protein n=1 Tax=Vibrio sp. Of7-15 TaxID=2724879 RepID=UPI001EF222B4|nr:DUF2867 domain-containing protein [Vibrio sp. Of7-15]
MASKWFIFKDQNMVEQIEFPSNTRINGKEVGSFYRDSFSCKATKKDLNAAYVYHAIFAYLPKPVQIALKIRNTIVKWFGFSVADVKMALPLENIEVGKQAGFLTFETVSDSEVITVASEKNMDIWLSVMKLSEHEYAVSTLVNLKTGSGRFYMALIKPFHKLIAKYCITQAINEKRI